MGFADKLKDLAKKAEDEAATHQDQVHKAVLKAEAAADRQTGGQYHDQIAKASQKADAYVDGLKEPGSSQERAAGQQPPVAPEEPRQ